MYQIGKNQKAPRNYDRINQINRIYLCHIYTCIYIVLIDVTSKQSAKINQNQDNKIWSNP